jgi:hypothetical protein
MRAGRVGMPLLAGLLALSSLSGCTRSLEMNYSPALYRLPKADQLKGIELGVAKLEDRRSSVERSDLETLGYVMRAGVWKFGLTHQGREYVPVADLVQSLFVDEFKRAGVEAKAIPKILTKDSVEDMRDAGQQAGTAYVLGGRVLVFEIVNEPGLWTVTSRRSVTLEINLVRVKGGDVVLDNTVSLTDRDESMVVTPGSSVDRLMNNVFRRVVTQVVEQVAAKLALDPRDVDVRIAIVSR